MPRHLPPPSKTIIIPTTPPFQTSTGYATSKGVPGQVWEVEVKHFVEDGRVDALPDPGVLCRPQAGGVDDGVARARGVLALEVRHLDHVNLLVSSLRVVLCRLTCGVVLSVSPGEKCLCRYVNKRARLEARQTLLRVSNTARKYLSINFHVQCTTATTVSLAKSCGSPYHHPSSACTTTRLTCSW